MKAEKPIFPNDNPQDLISSIFYESTDGLLLINPRHEIILANPSVSSILKRSHSSVVGSPFKNFFPDIEITALFDQKPQTSSNEMGVGLETTGIRETSERFPLFLTLSKIIRNESAFYIAAFHDLSNFKEELNILKTERSQLQEYLRVSQSIILKLDKTPIVTLINKRGLEVLGYEREEILGKHWIKTVLDDHLVSAYQKEWDQIVKGEKDIRKAFTYPIKTKNGSSKIIRWQTSINKDQDGNFKTLLASGTDNSELEEKERELRLLNNRLEKEVAVRTNELVGVVNRLLNANRKLDIEIKEREKVQAALKRSEQELRNSLEKELELNGLKSRFLSMASHEFKTPLSTILSSINLLERYNLEEKDTRKSKHYNRIKNAINDMNGMLSDFFSVSQFKEGKIHVHQKALGANEFTSKVVERFKVNMREDQSIILERLPLETTFFSDPQLLRNVLLNLLSNASKYSKEGDAILLRVKSDKENIFFEVTDRGMGIPQEEQKHLFTRFFRATNAINVRGTGLGLNIVRDYLKVLNGTISLESKVNIGSTFTIRIPKNFSSNEEDSNHRR